MKRLRLHAKKSLKYDNINRFCLRDSDKDRGLPSQEVSSSMPHGDITRYSHHELRYVVSQWYHSDLVL